MSQIDCSIYVTFNNNTGESLVDGKPYVLENHGKWIDFPSLIRPHSSSVFRLIENTWFTGTDGTFTYDIHNPEGLSPSEIHTHQSDPYDGSNSITYYNPPKPVALYTLSFRARVADGVWTPDYVIQKGHPVHVEYTLGYERQRRFRFQLVDITATSNHPVRNSRKELISGEHTLWSQSHSSDYPDGYDGSFQPNVFAYEFDSQVSVRSALKVTVRPLDPELIGTEAILFGTRDGKRVIKSDPFFFRDHNDVTVRARVVDPEKSGKPFVLNADVVWNMELKLSGQGVDCVGERTTKLELYWIATGLHRAFKAYIPVAFLRNVLPKKTSIRAEDLEFYQFVTERVFYDYHKQYDTVKGEAQFGVTYYGGNFYEALYFLEHPETPTIIGSFLPFVNCMDQAAMLELCCSLYGGFFSTSWLYQTPFGYINTTHLVGVTDPQGALRNVNNPFFGTDVDRAELPINDERRIPFGLHVYNGHQSDRFNRVGDSIYDACSGPHLGNETIAEFITNSIDTQTTLYQKYPQAGPGTTANVAMGLGLTGIDGQEVFLQSRPIPPLTELLSHLIDTAMANTAGPLAYVGWAHLPIWLNAILGDAWDVQYEQVSVSEAGAQALWVISNANTPDSLIRVHVNVISVIAQDGNLDMERSIASVKENIGNILMSTERHDVWTSGTLPGLEGVTLQYSDRVAAGRIVLVAGNVVIDISGMMTSYEALLPYALKLLNQTLCRNVGLLDRSPPVVPVLQRQAIKLGINTSGTATLRETEAGIITVTGIDTRFSVVFSVSCKIATANAGSEEHGILFDHHIVEELDNGEGCTVEFLFIAREVGRHRVRVCVADLETMIANKLDLEVEVVSAQEKVYEESDE